MAEEDKKGRNKPRTTTKNIEKKKRDKKIKRLDDMGSYHLIAGNLSKDDIKYIGKERKRIDEEAARDDRPSKGRNVPREFRNGGVVDLGDFKGSF